MTTPAGAARDVRPAAPGRDALVAAHHRRSVRQVADYVVGATWYIGVWFWVIALVIGVVVLEVQRRTEGVDVSALNGPAGSAKFFLFVMGIVLPLALVSVHVAAGGTRRSLTHGLVVGAVGVGVSFGLAVALLAWAEWWIFRSAGWDAVWEDQLYEDGSQVGLVLLVQSVFCLVYFLAGMTIAMGYYRAGTWWGTALLPLPLVPVALVELVLQSGAFGGAFARALGLDGATAWVAVGGALVAIALAVGLLRLFVRDVPMRAVVS
jgi:hypothetical protein